MLGINALHIGAHMHLKYVPLCGSSTVVSEKGKGSCPGVPLVSSLHLCSVLDSPT